MVEVVVEEEEEEVLVMTKKEVGLPNHVCVYIYTCIRSEGKDVTRGRWFARMEYACQNSGQ